PAPRRRNELVSRACPTPSALVRRWANWAAFGSPRMAIVDAFCYMPAPRKEVRSNAAFGEAVPDRNDHAHQSRGQQEDVGRGSSQPLLLRLRRVPQRGGQARLEQLHLRAMPELRPHPRFPREFDRGIRDTAKVGLTAVQ